MIGLEGCARALSDLLTAEISAEVLVTSAANGPLSDGTGMPADDAPPDTEVDYTAIAALVTPQLVVPAPPADIAEVDVDSWPFLAVSVRKAPRIIPLPATSPGVDVGNSRQWSWEYEATVFTWIRGDGYAQVQAVRDRLLLSVVQCLLRHQTWATSEALGGVLMPDGLRLIDNTLVVDGSPAGFDAQMRATVAGGYVRGRWRSVESLPAVPSYGVVDSLEISVRRADTP